ncbi:inter-alpha-trypsin inhibitor heavy chain H4-like [Ruditapes philippinarum]|uniref:inter-alpha-trypsin inhibitor heavy chain H4-like n=1 Tax=Ruditapes philippinarum TaxID=129788 RepID=UPI00295B30B2|nr:inter-alpha-trypsin inhibitor heavy chain H4-like [Ruditapes philippinarum]
MKVFATILSVLVICALTVVNTVQCQGINNVDVQVLEISSEAVFRYAKVLIRSLMINRNSADQEVAFQVRLPKEAYITSFVIITGGRKIKALIKEKKKAQDAYDKAKKDNVTAGLVSQQSIRDDLDLEIFKIDVNVAANAEVEFLLEYEEFLQRHAQKYSQKLFIDSNHVIPNLEVRCKYKEKQKFKYLSYKTPYLKQRVLPEEGALSHGNYYVQTVQWKPSETEQELAVEGLKKPFEVEYELDLEDNGGMVFINNDGHFVYLFSGPCTENKIMNKQIVFVIDISGSMSGNPIQQVRLAMSSILSQLRETDYFSIVIFNDISTMWKTSFQRGSSENINAAKIFVRDNVLSKGSTNINDALLQAIDLFGTSESVERYGQIIVFLTDGEPSTGVVNTRHIRANVRDKNHVHGKCCKTTINTIAFGRNADIEFLQQIAYENAGTLTIIKEIDNSLAESELVSTYNNIENPYYKDLRFDFEVAGESLPEANFTQAILPLYDCGSEIVISGSAIPGEDIFPTVKLIGAQNDITFNTVPTVLIVGSEANMLTRLAVYQKVKQLLKEAEISLDKNERDAANNLALKLALEYRFVTPLTSLIVTDYASDGNDGFMYSDYSFEMVPMSANSPTRRSGSGMSAKSDFGSYSFNSSDKDFVNFGLFVNFYLLLKLII